MPFRLARDGDTTFIKTSGNVSLEDRSHIVTLLSSTGGLTGTILVDHSAAALDMTKEEATAFGHILGKAAGDNDALQFHLIVSPENRSMAEYSTSVAASLSNSSFMVYGSIDELSIELQNQYRNATLS